MQKQVRKGPHFKMSILCRRIVALVRSGEQKTTLLDFLQKKVQSSKSMINVFYAAIDNATIVFFGNCILRKKKINYCKSETNFRLVAKLCFQHFGSSQKIIQRQQISK